ncbi:MAG: hypothetical protein AAF411_15020 [Myxococcota bacterium]
MTTSQETLETDEQSRGPWARAMRIEWLGQMAASGFWIASVFSYGVNSTGDVLQLLAASAWAVANIAALAQD